MPFILLIPFYNSELWFYSCTAGDRSLILRPFERANFTSDIEDIFHQRAVHTAENSHKDQDHFLNHCCTRGRRSFVSAKSRTTIYRDSFIPTINVSVF